MRKLILSLALAGIAYASIAFVISTGSQSAGTCNGHATSVTCAVTLTTASDLVLVGVATNSTASISAVTDDDSGGSTSYTQIGTTAAVANSKTYLYYGYPAHNGSHTITVATGATTSFITIVPAEFSGAATSLPLDATVNSTGDGSTGTITCGSTAGLTGELLVGMITFNVGGAANYVQNGSWLLAGYLNTGATNESGVLVYQVVGSTTNFSPAVTVTGNGAAAPCVAASLKVAAASTAIRHRVTQ